MTSLLIGHFGRIGPLRFYVPPAAKNLTRELGLMLFLAGAGTNAGAHLVDVIKDQGWILLLAGAGITIFSTLAGLFVMLKIYNLNLLSAMGALTAGMTNPPALASPFVFLSQGHSRSLLGPYQLAITLRATR